MSTAKAKKKQDKPSDPAAPATPKKTKKVELIVRPSLSGVQKYAHAYANIDTLRSAGLEAGAFVQISNNTCAVATPADIDADVLLVSAELRRLSGLTLGDRIILTKAARPPIAAKVEVEAASEKDIKKLLEGVNIVHAGLNIGDVLVTKVDTELSIENLSLSDDGPKRESAPAIVTPNTKVVVSESRESSPINYYGKVGGLDRELKVLRTKIELPLQRPELFERFCTAPERGFLLHGPPGTGKTMLLKAVAAAYESVHILRVNGPSIYSKYLGETESALRGIFEEAQRFEPALIFIDEIDALAPRRDSDESGETESRVVATMLTLMDGMAAGRRVVVLGATNRPNKLDPALRRPGRFGVEIEIGIPDAAGRRQILELMVNNGMPHHLTPADIDDIAGKTHGYVGADLQALVHEAVMAAIESSLSAGLDTAQMFAGRENFEQALITVRPSAMREIFLETPKVHWTDIGGQSATIQRLKETVEWPLSHADAFDRLGISTPRGVLLYGPPGCSKTLLAKALATEAGLNFLAVKGPEIFNKYVGESERAVREIFRKARQAAPSIIFFDEIDALSVARGEGEAGGDRVLTSLLNEMDGIEALKGVVVLAATNRPDVIDSALMRPGRLDRLIYVSPPDVAARRQILLIQFSKMAIDDAVDLDVLAAATEGYSGAEIVAVCQEAGLLAMNEDVNITAIRQDHFEKAIKGIKRQITPAMLEYFTSFSQGQA